MSYVIQVGQGYQNILGDIGISIENTIAKHECQKAQDMVRFHRTTSEVPKSGRLFPILSFLEWRVHLGLKPVSRGMHVTHNAIKELSKTQPEFLGSVYLLERLVSLRKRETQRHSQNVVLSEVRKGVSLSPKAAQHSFLRAFSVTTKTQNISRFKYVSPCEERHNVQLKRQATFNNGLSVFQPWRSGGDYAKSFLQAKAPRES